MKLLLLPITLLLLFGCNGSNNLKTTTKAARVVHQASDHTVKQLPISNIKNSFIENGSESNHNHSVIEISGEVIAYGLTEDGVYMVTLREDGHEALCTFDASISDQMGGGRTVSSGSSITVREQCQSSGLFASHPFTLHGCKIVTD